ncbi:MAG: CDP-alcohol phosphatidyltransferase family protein [Gaiellaceae bacterium]
MSAPAVSPPLALLPNALTLARLVLVPIFAVVLLAADGGHSWTAGVVFVVAGTTDQVDGYLARRWRVESRFGALADPLADRLMIDIAVILLWLDSRLPLFALAVVLVRDGLLLLGGSILTPRGIEISVNGLGKAATWALYSSLGCVLVTHEGTTWPLLVFWTGVGMAVVAGLMYVRTALGALRR